MGIYIDDISVSAGGSAQHFTLTRTGTALGLTADLSGSATEYLNGAGAFTTPTGGVPGAHATTHEPGGADALAVDAVAGTGSLRTIGTTATAACAGNDSRLSDARTPSPHKASHEPGGADALAVDAVAGTGSLRTIGTTATSACAGNDSRLSDARTPTTHATSHQSGGGDSIKLDDLATPDDNTDLNSSTARHGLLKKLDGIATNYLDGTGAFSVPPGTGGSGDVTGPTGATPDALAAYADISGKVIRDSLATISATGVLASSTVQGNDYVNAGAKSGGWGGGGPTGVVRAASSTNDGTGDCFSGYDSDGVKVFGVDSNGAITANSATTTKAGLLPILSGTATEYLNGSGAWSTPTGGVPAAHASTHNAGGADAMAIDAVAGTGSLRTIGTTATSACAGNDSRLSDARTPTAHALDHATLHSAPTDVTTHNATTSAHGLLPKLSGTATQYLNGTGAFSTPAGGSAYSKNFEARAYQPTSVSATIALNNLRDVLLFDAATDEAVCFSDRLKGYAGAGLSIGIQWASAAATTGAVVWDVSVERINVTGQTLNSDSFATAKSATTTVSGTAGVMVTTTITFTSGAEMDSAVEGDWYRIKINRDANHASDTLVGDAMLYSVTVEG